MAATNPAWQSDAGAAPRKNSTEGPESIQRVFLRRLRRLAWLRRSCAQQLDAPTVRALDKAIYSTFCDCAELGLADEARELLKTAP